MFLGEIAVLFLLVGLWIGIFTTEVRDEEQGVLFSCFAATLVVVLVTFALIAVGFTIEYAGWLIESAGYYIKLVGMTAIEALKKLFRIKIGG